MLNLEHSNGTRLQHTKAVAVQVFGTISQHRITPLRDKSLACGDTAVYIQWQRTIDVDENCTASQSKRTNSGFQQLGQGRTECALTRARWRKLNNNFPIHKMTTKILKFAFYNTKNRTLSLSLHVQKLAGVKKERKKKITAFEVTCTAIASQRYTIGRPLFRWHIQRRLLARQCFTAEPSLKHKTCVPTTRQARAHSAA